jgi:type VI secretion system secreted protein VgrG
VTFRPARTTPKPLVHGAQTAVVVGPPGEEIYTDNHGRIKVQFHWDRDGKKNDKSSCWIRVSQPWAGKNWGAIWLPRIGQEVVVDFLEGDPDCPIIVGRLYNAEQPVPYGLPANMTQSGFKSRSSKGGGTEDYNEIRFEDKKGQEMITVHAQYDMETTVEHDDTKTVLNGNQKVTVEKGNRTVNITMGKEEHEAMQSIELKVGGSSIKLEPAKITIKSPMIQIQGDAKVDVTAPMTSVTGSGILTLQGGLVKIN